MRSSFNFLFVFSSHFCFFSSFIIFLNVGFICFCFLLVRLVIIFHKMNFSPVIDSEWEKLIHRRNINNRDKQCRFIYQFVRVTLLEIHFRSGADRNPEWFFSYQDLDPDPAKSLGSDRIRMHNTGTYTWTTFKRAKIPISKNKPSMILARKMHVENRPCLWFYNLLPAISYCVTLMNAK